MRRRAFTLVEMMVALAVTGLLSVLMLRMFMDSSSIWKANDERLETFREARAALQMMSRELAAINPAPDLPAKFPLLAIQPHRETLPEDQVNQEIYALTSTRNRGKGDLCAVGYFCAWDDTRKTFTLRRLITGSDTTFRNLQGILSASMPAGMAGAFDLIYQRSQPEEAVLPEGGDENCEVEDLATYVWNLEFAIPDKVVPGQIDTRYPQPEPFNRELPEWIEIRFKALGSSAARKLEGQEVTRETWFSDESSLHQRLILPNEQQFVTRVKLTR